jgi:hypothetical protein
MPIGGERAAVQNPFLRYPEEAGWTLLCREEALDLRWGGVPTHPDRHRRQSLWLKGYDYRRAGAYFLTICTRQRECVLGEVVDGGMRLSERYPMATRSNSFMMA